MDKPNPYAEFIENYDLDSLTSNARAGNFSAETKLELIEALETTLSYLSYEYDCKKMSDIGEDYLEAVMALGDLKGEKDYFGISSYYFYLIGLREKASVGEVDEWLSRLEENITEGLSQSSQVEEMTHVQIRYLKLFCELRGDGDSQIVKTLFDTIQAAVQKFPNSNFWSTWLYTAVDFKEDKSSPQTLEIVNQSLKDFNSLSESLYKSQQLDPIEFYKQLGAYHFLEKLPDQVEAKISFWIHKAIEAERPLLSSLSNSRLRDQGILFLNAYENHDSSLEVIKHAEELNTLSWQRFSNWNSLLFYLKSKVLLAIHLQKNGNTQAGLDVFNEAFQVAENVRHSVDLYQKDNFSLGSPLLEFYQKFAEQASGEEQRKRLTEIRFAVAKATIVTGESSYLFPYEHLLACAAYLGLPDDFKRSWMQMNIVLCRYAHSIYDQWKDHDFVKKNKVLSELFQQCAFLFAADADINPHLYHNKYPVILHDLSEAELKAEWTRFLDWAKAATGH